MKFPPRWEKVEDRIDARRIIEENTTLLKEVERQRRLILQAGFQLGDVMVDDAGPDGISFRVQIKNATDGHSVPTGFDAERVIFLRVTVSDKDGRVVFRSGDFDPNGDLRDEQSLYVHNGEIPKDEYLFNLKTILIVRMVRGGEREQVLPLNYSPSPLQFLRPSTLSTFLLGRPVGARKHRQVIPPLEDVWGEYEVSRDDMRGSIPPYTARIELVSGMVPVNLVHEVKDVGFDYNMSAREVAEALVAGYMTLWDRKVELKRGRYAQNTVQSTDAQKKGN
jgi:hypothetical protein